jgi:AcrR family transcriptional regulator|nr:TetR/AcrR family transcriptional regulator [uncultured Methanoregula sp.]
MPRINAEYREDARKKIIAAALDVAASDGWGALTLDAIAKKVGVTKGAFYAYFTSSGSLMQDVIVELIRIIRNHILEHWQDENDIHEVLDRAADFIFLQPKPFIPIFIQAMAGLPEDPVFRKKIDSLLEENSALIETAIARFQKSGQIPGDVDLDEAVRAIYALTIGLGMMTHILGKDPEKGRTAWIMATERILKIGPRT